MARLTHFDSAEYAHMRILIPIMSTTSARRRLIRSLLTERPVASQQDLVGILEEGGISTTQATVSRDLAAIGAVKEDDGYTLRPVTEQTDQAGLRHLLDDFAVAIVPSGNLVVVRTPPGAAHVLGAALDGAALDGVIGTVAGDDTLLVVCAEDVGGRALAHRLDRIGATK